MTAGDSVDLPVLANDNDPEGDPLAMVAIDAPGHGTIRSLPDQTIRYTPQHGFAGIDSFAYTVGDGQGGVGTAQRHGDGDDSPTGRRSRATRRGRRPRPARR